MGLVEECRHQGLCTELEYEWLRGSVLDTHRATKWLSFKKRRLCLVCIVMSFLVCIFVVTLCVLLSSYVYLLYYVCIAVFFTLDAGLLARSQYSEGPATGHHDTGFSWFPCVYKQMLRWFPRFQVPTTCFSCSPPDLNLLVTNFVFCIHVK